MPKLAASTLALAAILSASVAAQAGGYDRYPAPPAHAGQVHNYYGPVTVYNGQPAYSYGYAYPQTYSTGSSAYGSAYAGAYANAYANAYAGSSGHYSGYGYSDYGAPWGEPFAGGVGYSPYGNYGGYGYGAQVYGARMDPWNGYNGAPGNGYW